MKSMRVQNYIFAYLYFLSIFPLCLALPYLSFHLVQTTGDQGSWQYLQDKNEIIGKVSLK